MAKTISELRNQSIQVRDASAAGENTATRVGTVLNDIVGHIEEYENTQSSNNSSQDAKIEGVKSSLNAEIARAKTEESNLRTQIGTERTERQAAVSREETARIQADNDEKTARQQADNAEQDARIKADNDEKTARENADITLRTMIQTEVSNRQIAVKQEEIRAMAAELANTQAIEDENARATTAEAAETARAKAEEERLQGEIDNTNDNLNSLDNKVNSNHDHLTDEVARLDTADNEIKADLEAETARAQEAELANTTAIETEKERAEAADNDLRQQLTKLELKTDKNNIISVNSNNVLQGSIKKDGSFNLNDSAGWEYVLFLVAPNDKITFKASGYNTNVISFYSLGQIPSANTYIEGIASDGNGSSSYKEYNAIAKDFLIAAVCWYRPYGTPYISIERTSLIENINSIIIDYKEKFSNTEETIGKIVGNGGLYSIANSYINLNGNVSDSEDYNATDYILIDKSQDIIISNALTTASTCLISFYDKNKKFISDSAINNVESIHIEASHIPEDAVYFRSCTKKETLNSVRIYNNTVHSFQKFYEQNISRINDLIINDRVFSTNEDVNVYIKEVYAPLYKKTNNYITIRIAALSKSGKYYNGVILGNDFMFYDLGYETAEDAIAAANQYDGILSYKGNYIIVDFTSVETAINKDFVGDYYDVTKLVNSPNINKFLEPKIDFKDIIGNNSVVDIEVGKNYTEIDKTGKLTTGDTGTYKISTRINVTEGDVIKVTGSGFNTLMIAEYKAGSEPTPLSFIGGTPCENRVVKEYEYVCQENGYVLICWASGYAQVTSYTHVTGGRLKTVENLANKTSKLIDVHTPLNILIFGDSITDTATIVVDKEDKSAKTIEYKLPYLSNSYTNKDGEVVRFSMWPALLRKAFNVFDIRCYARYGASYTDSDSNTIFRQNLSDQIALAFNDFNNPNGVFMTQGNFVPDIVIFALSANDSPTPSDTFEIAMSKTIMSADGNSFDIEATLNNLDITQYNQAVRYAFLKLKNQFPYAQMFCICPPQRSAYDIGEMQKEVDLKRMAQRYSINIIDAAATCGIVRDLEVKGGVDVYSKDGLHPNDYGQKLYARMVINAIKNNMIDMTIFD